MSLSDTIPARERSSGRRRLALLSAGVVFVCLLMTASGVVNMVSTGFVEDRPPLWTIVAMSAETWLPWGLLAPLVAFLTLRFHVLEGWSWRFVAVHLAAACAISAGLVFAWTPISTRLFAHPHDVYLRESQFWCMPDEFAELAERKYEDGALVYELPEGVELEPETSFDLPRVEFVDVEAVEGFVPDDRKLFFGELTPPFVPAFGAGIVAYLALLAVCQGLLAVSELSYRREADALLTARLERMRLDALRSRVDPHFLYNTLTVISATIREDPDAARAMVADLGRLLRESSARTGDAKVSVEHELSIVRAYSDLLQRRFTERLNVEFDVEETAAACLVPSWSVQPLLENVVVHGVEVSRETVTARVRATTENGSVVVEVTDDAPRTNGEDHHVGGTAHANLRERLEALFGPEARLEAGELEGRGYRATMRLPREGGPQA